MDNVQSLNQELAAYGFPAPLRLVEGYDEENSQILRCITSLLQQRQRDMDYREQMDDQHRRLVSEQETLLSNMSKLRGELEASDRMVDITKGKVTMTEATLRDVNEKHRNTKEELKNAKNNLLYSRSQFAHDIRKREQESVKLKDKMQRMAADKYKASKVGIQLLNPLVKDKTLMGHDRPVKDRELVDIVLGNYEEREQELLAENEQLRGALYELYAHVTELLQAKVDDHDDLASSQDGSETNDQTDAPRHYRDKVILPYELVRDRLNQDMQKLVEDLKGDWQSMHHQAQAQVDAGLLAEKEATLHELRLELETLQNKIQGYKDVIAEQSRVIEMSLSATLRHPPRQDSDALGINLPNDLDPDALQEEREALEKQRAELEEERRKFTEAAILLGQERESLRKERDALLEHKQKLQTAAILNNIPSTPHYLKNLNLEDSTPEVLQKIQALQLGTEALQDQAENTRLRNHMGSPLSALNGGGRPPVGHSAYGNRMGVGSHRRRNDNRRVSIADTPLRSRSRSSARSLGPD
ncbi:hypothetical protein IWQ62_001120 [Dispira parvispora]|uniref:Uncharacterized protein n=1 Tax=Dispira parvispora TaxID=1520584 RepID=A0A9W8ATB6_9FUNG|nr:hypothetical protein IWQ62_001120 [Dispira parvispora]